MQTANEMRVIDVLNTHPNSSKVFISEQTGFKGIVLFNLLRKLENEGQIKSVGEEADKTYSSPVIPVEEPVKEIIPETKQPEETKIAPIVSFSVGRDKTKYTFNGETYGKGQFVRKVVETYVAENRAISYDKLKTVFPDTLLKRFGIFQSIEKARELSGKTDRYFMKPEHLIVLKDKKNVTSICVCSQFTFDNIQPFLKVAKELGFKWE